MELAVGLPTVWRSALLIQDALNLILLNVACWLFCFGLFFNPQVLWFIIFAEVLYSQLDSRRTTLCYHRDHQMNWC